MTQPVFCVAKPFERQDEGKASAPMKTARVQFGYAESSLISPYRLLASLMMVSKEPLEVMGRKEKKKKK